MALIEFQIYSEFKRPINWSSVSLKLKGNDFFQFGAINQQIMQVILIGMTIFCKRRAPISARPSVRSNASCTARAFFLQKSVYFRAPSQVANVEHFHWTNVHTYTRRVVGITHTHTLTYYTHSLTVEPTGLLTANKNNQLTACLLLCKAQM